MKKLIAILLLCTLVIAMLPFSALAANDAYILAQPQNYVYNVGAVAFYSVTVAGEHLQCTWYLEYDGKTYNLSEPGASGPWVSYVTGACGSAEEKDNLGFTPSHTTFSYFFEGCEEGLNGAYIYADIYDGWDSIESSKALIQLSEGAKSPPLVFVPTEVEVCKGDQVELECSATAIYGGALSYTWYETPDGDLRNIHAIDRGAESNAKLVYNADQYGMHYYVCMVSEEGGGTCYSSIIPVLVMEKQQVEPDETEPVTEPVTEPATEPTTEPTAEPTAEPTTEPTTEPTQPQSPQSGAAAAGNVWIYVGIGLGVLVAGMVVAIVLLLKPKKKNGNETGQ